MKAILACLPLTAALLFAPVAHAAGLASPDDAKAMAIKAAEYLKSVGPEKAFAEFDAKDGPWHDRDLYVTVQDSKGVMVAHGTNRGPDRQVRPRPEGRRWQAVQSRRPGDQGSRLDRLQMAESERPRRSRRRPQYTRCASASILSVSAPTRSDSIQRRGCAMKLLNNLPITGKSLISTVYSARSWSLAWLASPSPASPPSRRRTIRRASRLSL